MTLAAGISVWQKFGHALGQAKLALIVWNIKHETLVPGSELVIEKDSRTVPETSFRMNNKEKRDKIFFIALSTFNRRNPGLDVNNNLSNVKNKRMIHFGR